MPRTSLLFAILTAVISLTFSNNAVASGAARSGGNSEPLVVTAENSSSVALSYELAGLERQTVTVGGENYDLLSLPDEPVVGREGSPELPSVMRLVLIPPQSGVRLVINRAVTRVEPGARPLPRQPQKDIDDPAVGVQKLTSGDFTPLNQTLTTYDGFWPPKIAELGKPAIMRGYRVVQVVVNPVRWNPQTGELQIVESVDLELDFNTSEYMVNTVANPDRPRPSRYASRLLRSIVVNPPPERDEVDFGGSIVYVLGEGNEWDDLLDEINVLVEWRRRMGWTVEVMQIDNIQNNADDVLEALRDAYEDWEIPPEYVVLCGDADQVGGQTMIPFWDKRAGAGNPYESDTPYALLEGDDDDYLPEVALGRLIAYNAQMIRDQVGKIVNYESDPYMGPDNDGAWYLRAAGASASWQSGASSNDLVHWFGDLVLDCGFADFGGLYWTDQNIQPDPSPFISDWFGDGISVFLFRGWRMDANDYTQPEAEALDNGRMLPFTILATCNTGDYGEQPWGFPYAFSEYFMKNPDGGSIACIGVAGATQTAYNNLISSAILRGPFVEDIYSTGWALMRGKLALYSHYAGRGDINHSYNRDMEAWLTHYWIYNLMGDPATDIYTTTPIALAVEHPDTIRIGDTRFETTVTYEDSGEPVAGARVCLYKPEVFQLRAVTDAEGRVVFSLYPDWTQDGEIQFTVTGHNLKPYLEDFAVGQAEQFIGAGAVVIDDDAEGESDGDGDGVANPTERLELTVNINNYGSQQPDGPMTAQLTATSPYLEVVSGEAQYDQAPDSGEAVAANFVVDIGGGFPAGQDAVFDLTVTIGEEEWFSAVVAPVVGPDLQLDSLEWDGDPLRPSGIADLHIVLKNIGGKGSPDLDATLISLTATISVMEESSTFAGVAVGEEETSSGMFELSASLFHFGGNPANFALALAGDDGFQDTAFFSFVVDTARDGQPFGPDAYGYVCFDDTDEDWFAMPVYSWVEIDPDQDGNGTDTEMEDSGDERDQSVVVDFPDEFQFRYYDEDFDQVTICTNGWAALGEHRDQVAFRNRKIPDGECVPAMLCPFWEELITTNQGGVFYWFDEANHRYIIEWSQMQKFGNLGVNEPSETFELILYDPRYYPSFTGDGTIEFQYQDVTDDRSCYQAYDTPFASVGIVSPDLKTGLEYVYWNEYHPGAAELADERIIKFTTIIEYRKAWAKGTVTDAETGELLPEVRIGTKFGFSAVTDDSGYYFIDNMLASNGDSTLFYWFKAFKQGWNDSTVYDIDLPEGDTVTVDFALLHPEFLLNPVEVNLDMLTDTLVEGEVRLSNDGNGPLYFDSKFTYDLGENRRDEMWDQLLTWNAEDSTGCNQMRGVTYSNERWIVTGDGDPAQFYIFSRGADYQGEIQQPEGRRGMRDLEAHGNYIYAVPFSNYYLKVDAVTLEEAFRVPMNINNLVAITLDQNGLVYTSGTSGPIYVFEETDDTTVTQVATYETVDPRSGVNIFKYGMSWFRDDPDGYQLYIMGKNQTDANGKNLYKLNVETGDIRFVTDFPMLSADYDCKGISITPRWNNMVWVLSAVFNHPEGDQVFVFELGPNASWLRYNPPTDTLNTGESVPIALHFNTEGLELGDYGVVIDFTHNALGGRTALPVNLTIVDTLLVPPDTTDTIDDVLTPHKFALLPNRPNPFNPITTISYSLDRTARVKLTVWDLAGRLVATLRDEDEVAGNHYFAFDAAGIPNGVYIYRLEAGERVVARKMVLLK